MKYYQEHRNMSGKKFNGRLKICVYAWTRGRQWLYVGVSGNFWERMSRHNIVDRIEKVLDADRIRIWKFSSFDDALSYECFLINKKHPKYNSKMVEVAINKPQKRVEVRDERPRVFISSTCHPSKFSFCRGMCITCYGKFYRSGNFLRKYPEKTKTSVLSGG